MSCARALFLQSFVARNRHYTSAHTTPTFLQSKIIHLLFNVIIQQLPICKAGAWAERQQTMKRTSMHAGTSSREKAKAAKNVWLLTLLCQPPRVILKAVFLSFFFT